MEAMFEEDLRHSTEIVLKDSKRVRSAEGPEPPSLHARRSRRGSAERAALGALGVGSAVGAVMTNRRVLGPAEARVMLAAGLLLLFLSVVAVLWPRWITLPLAFVGLWSAFALLYRANKLRRAPVSSAGRPPAPAGEARVLNMPERAGKN